MESSLPPFPNQPTFKQVLMFEDDKSSPLTHEQTPSDFLDGRKSRQVSKVDSQICFTFTEDNVPIVDPRLLPGVVIFE